MSDTLTKRLVQVGAERPFLIGQRLSVAHDGFEGTVQGYYVTREGKPGLVLQQDGTRVVHVYGEKWFSPKAETPAPDADGWIKWDGGGCPVDSHVTVEASRRDGAKHIPMRASMFRWGHLLNGSDIIAYRVVKD